MLAPDVVISIVDHENRELVRRCLLSLPAACDGLDWEVTVIDNVSGDGSVEMLACEFPDVHVLENQARMGFGANHNQVLRPLIEGSGEQAAPRYALILNDDTSLQPAAVSRMVQMLDADPMMAAVAPTILDREGRAGATRIAYPNAKNAWRCDWTGRTEPPDSEQGFLQGCCLLLRVTAIAQIGPFDERFFLFYEDADLSRRLADAGWYLNVCAEAVVEHLGHVSVLGPALAVFTPKQGRRSRYLYLCKHEGRAGAELITTIGRLLLLVRAARATAGAIRRHDPARRSRARRLFGLARLNPRYPVFPDPRANIVPAPRRQRFRTGSR